MNQNIEKLYMWYSNSFKFFWQKCSRAQTLYKSKTNKSWSQLIYGTHKKTVIKVQSIKLLIWLINELVKWVYEIC